VHTKIWPGSLKDDTTRETWAWWGDNNIAGLKEIGCENVDWIQVAPSIRFSSYFVVEYVV
jgi:hypothetical protein